MTATAPDRTLAWTAPALAVMVLAVLAAQGAGEAGVRMAVRATARTSAALLCLALASHAFTDGLVHRRAGLVRSLAVSHGLHLLVVLRLAWLTSGENLRARSSVLTVAGGVLAYAALAAAFFRPEHRWVDRGLLWVWVVFLAAYAPRALRQPLLYGPFVGALVIALALRVAGALARRPAAAAVPREDLAT